ncbi:hypothetical protein E3E14_26285 [Streptomyces sp. ICN441]|uniref:hypothetical protein n=1 Tax=Streptomyces sp. ICN441 TaxID=2558286 RepID=UPI00106D9D62|nr:hypothetical protein [Streptomyces sp. ICN441]TFE39000.1 hypothetical protein E3E14_26285 [Streptomyces sp. ICN441]
MENPNGITEPPVRLPVTASTLFARLTFDGHTLSITRRLWPLPWHRTRRIPLRDVMAVEGWTRDKNPGVDGKTFHYRRVRRYQGGEQFSRNIRIRRPRSALADRFLRFQEVVNEAVVDHARSIIDARGPGAPTGPAHWDAEFQARIAHGLRTPYPYADDEARFKNHTLLPGSALVKSGSYVLHQLRLRDNALLEWHRFLHGPPAAPPPPTRP